MRAIVDKAGEVLAKTTDEGILIGGQHRLLVAASAGEQCFWKDSGEPVKMDASLFRQLASLPGHSP